MQTLKRPLLLNLAIYGLYLAVAVVITWPLVTVLGTHFAGYPFGDAHEMTRHIWWIKTALQTGQPLIFQPLLGYPDGLQGVILWSDPLQFFPGWLFAFYMPLPMAYNVFALLTLALNGWAAYWLVWKLTDARAAALLGGLTFMSAPVMQGHLAGGHGGLLVQWPLPLLAYSLLQVTGGHASRRHLILAVVFFVLTPLGHTLQLIYAVLPLVAVMGITLVARRDWRALLRLMGISAVGAGLLLIFLLPVFSSTFGTSAYTGEGGGVDYSLDLLGIVTPSFNHPLYGQLAYTHSVLGVNIVEGSGYIGLMVGLLALLAVWKVKAARWWLLVGAAAWVLALGPLLKVLDQPLKIPIGTYDSYLTLPYALVYNLPGFSLARTPGRFDFVVALAVAVLVGYGWRVVEGKFKALPTANPYRHNTLNRRLAILTVVIGLLIVMDYQAFWPLPTYDATIPQAVSDLAQRTDVRAVYDVPWDNVLAAKDALWLQTAHGKPMIAGQVTRKTPVSPAKLTLLEQTFNPALLHEAGADVVIVHKFYDQGGRLLANARKTLGSPTYEDDLLALFAVKAEAQPALTTVDTIDTISSAESAYVYAPESGWLRLRRTAFGNNRRLSLALDGDVLHDWLVTDTDSGTDVSLMIPIRTAGYHTLTWAVDPPCPTVIDPVLDCRSVMLAGMNAPYELQAAAFTDAVRFSGVQLVASHIEADTRLDLDLLWQYDHATGKQDIRFIKILDSGDQAVYNSDESPGEQASGGYWLERVSFPDARSLPAGEYRVYVGWYTYPDLTRFKVLSDVPGAADGWAEIGSFSIQPQ